LKENKFCGKKKNTVLSLYHKKKMPKEISCCKRKNLAAKKKTVLSLYQKKIKNKYLVKKNTKNNTCGKKKRQFCCDIRKKFLAPEIISVGDSVSSPLGAVNLSQVVLGFQKTELSLVKLTKP